MDELAVIVPCFNEEKTIGLVIEDLQQYIPQAKIYIYNNNSTDKTVEVAQQYNVEIKHCIKQGKGNVIKQAFKEIDAKYYLILDGDYTSFAKDSYNLIEPLKNNDIDMVVGNRLNEYDKGIRSISNKLFRKLCKSLYRYISDDPLSGYRSFSRNFVKEINLESEGFTIEIEMEIKSQSFKVISVPVHYRERPEGSKSKLKAFKDGSKIVRYALKHKK